MYLRAGRQRFLFAAEVFGMAADSSLFALRRRKRSVSDCREYVQRGLCFLALSLALVWPGHGSHISVFVLSALALALYLFIPRVDLPDGALIYERVPAVYGPDAIGFFVEPVLFALPFWARSGEPYLWEDFGLLVHPAAVLTWPIALMSSAILVVAARYASFWLVIEDDGFRIHRTSGERYIGYEDIERVTGYRRALPAWLGWLAPLLALSGRSGAAAALALARDDIGLRLVLKDGDTVSIAKDSFEKPYRKIVRALRDHDVPLGEEHDRQNVGSGGN